MDACSLQEESAFDTAQWSQFFFPTPSREGESALFVLEMLTFGPLPRPERVKVPMLVMGGANDRVITVAEVEATARAYGTQAVIVPGIAHHMMLDKGWEAVADRMLAWLTEREALFAPDRLAAQTGAVVAPARSDGSAGR